MSIRHNAQATCLFLLLIFLLSGYSNCGAAAPVSASTNDGVIEVRVIGQKPDPWTRYGTVVGPVIAWIGTVIAIVIGVRNTDKQIKTKFDEIEKSYANERTTKETEREERRDSLVASLSAHSRLIEHRVRSYAEDLQSSLLEKPADIERMRIVLDPVFDMRWEDAYLLSEPDVYMTTILLKNAIGRANRRIDEIVGELSKTDEEEDKLKQKMQELALFYRTCESLARRSVDYLKNHFPKSEKFVERISEYFENLEKARSEARKMSDAEAQKTSGVSPRPGSPVDIDVAVSKTRRRAHSADEGVTQRFEPRPTPKPPGAG